MKTPVVALVAAVVLFGCGGVDRPGLTVGAGAEAGEKSEALTAFPEPTIPIAIPANPGYPAVTGLAPTIGLAGTVVTVTGTNLIQSGHTVLRPRYRFSNDLASSPSLAVTLVSGTQLRVTVPAGSFGGRFCLYNIAGTATSCTTQSFTVGDPNGKIRITNNAQVPVIGGTFDGAEWIAPQRIEPAGLGDLYPVFPDQYSMSLTLGYGPFAGPAANRVICSFNNPALNVPANTTTQVVVPALSIPNLLGHCGDIDYRSGTFVLRLRSGSNTWQAFDNGVLLRQGAVTTVSFGPNASTVTFALTGAGWPNIIVGFPFQTFIAGPVGQQVILERVSFW